MAPVFRSCPHPLSNRSLIVMNAVPFVLAVSALVDVLILIISSLMEYIAAHFTVLISTAFVLLLS